MSTGLLALLDDVVALVKLTATSLDDAAAQAVKVGGKAAGVVIDDAAVTPKYVVGLTPDRELPIIWEITKGSLFNKLIIILPAILVLGAFAPWLVTPILALGGLYLCFEGYEKAHEYLTKLQNSKTAATKDVIPDTQIPPDAIVIEAQELEAIRVKSAVRTDLILSAEIMALTYSSLIGQTLINQALTLLLVALVMTLGVYGSVGFIIKVDDFGLWLAKKSKLRALRYFGKTLVRGMPGFLVVLSVVGTLAMLWVGGGILLHSVPAVHHSISHFIEQLALPSPILDWLFEALLSALMGLLTGLVAERMYSIFRPGQPHQ